VTFVQLEYIVAVDTFRHFASAAGHCFVTQPTLSMQVQKLERELGVKIFDRSKQPVIPTESGTEIIEQARKILAQKKVIAENIEAKKGMVSGELRIGIIPTLAPYLVPLFARSFAHKYPNVRLVVNEVITETIVTKLREGKIDAGILVSPLQEIGIKEHVLFYEELLVFVSRKNGAFKKNYVLAQDIDPRKLWLLEEGHCFRSQIVNLCELRKASLENTNFSYEAGTIETLSKMVEFNEGITVLPELATTDFNRRQAMLIRHFRHPVPMREVSIAVHRDFVKQRLVTALKNEIVGVLPDKIKKNKNLNVIPF